MTRIRKLIAADINQLGDDEVEVVMSTAALARDGHVLVPQGCRLANYQANPIVLWSHDADKPIGNVESIEIAGDDIKARVRFAPLGISGQADETRGLVKAGVVRAVSVGFDPLDGEPLDRNKPKGGQRFTDWELLELSFVSVPADPGAVVTARTHGDDPVNELAPAAPTKRTREHRAHRAGSLTFTRGLYDVASLCYLFSQLGWHVDEAKFEAAIEGDGSAVPGMLVKVLVDLGEALIAMTQEEIAEALAGHNVEPEIDDGDEALEAGERQRIADAPTPAVRAFRRGLAHSKIRAGKTLSAETVRCLREAADAHEEAMTLHRSAIAKHKAGISAVNDLIERTASTDPQNEDDTTVQTSSGTDSSNGSANDRAAPVASDRSLDTDADNTIRLADPAELRRRQADMLALRSH